MSDRRAPVKVALLVLPLLALVLVLHAWGDSMAGGLGRAICTWKYPERGHQSQFLLRVPRGSGVEAWALRAIDDFVTQTVKSEGVRLALQVPAQPVTVILLDADAEPSRFGSSLADELNPNEGVFDAARRTVFVRMERKIQQDLVISSLRQAIARALLHDAGSARWSPWLTEGLVGRLDGARAADSRTWTGELPTLSELLRFGEADFRGVHRLANTRGARLLTAFLTERMPEKFAYYYKEEQAGLRPNFSERIGDLARVEREWRDWLQPK
jgi:hypothetical protein